MGFWIISPGTVSSRVAFSEYLVPGISYPVCPGLPAPSRTGLNLPTGIRYITPYCRPPNTIPVPTIPNVRFWIILPGGKILVLLTPTTIPAKLLYSTYCILPAVPYLLYPTYCTLPTVLYLLLYPTICRHRCTVIFVPVFRLRKIRKHNIYSTFAESTRYFYTVS